MGIYGAPQERRLTRGRQAVITARPEAGPRLFLLWLDTGERGCWWDWICHRIDTSMSRSTFPRLTARGRRSCTRRRRFVYLFRWSRLTSQNREQRCYLPTTQQAYLDPIACPRRLSAFW